MKGLGTRWASRSLPTQTFVWFYDSLISSCAWASFWFPWDLMSVGFFFFLIPQLSIDWQQKSPSLLPGSQQEARECDFYFCPLMNNFVAEG